MSLKLEDVKGLGKKIDNLNEAGIDTVEKLANAKIEDLLEIKGIGVASAQKLIDNAKELLGETSGEDISEEKETAKQVDEDEKKVQEDLKKLEEKKKLLEGKKVEEGDFILVKITARTQKGKVFQVSSVEDAKKAGIYDEKKEQQGYFTPEFVIVGKPGFLNEGLTETIKELNYFQKKSVRIPPTKAFGKRDPQKIERIGIAKFKKLNNGKNPELGQEFVKQTQQGQTQRGTVIRISQGKVIVDYNHPLAGQSIDYNFIQNQYKVSLSPEVRNNLDTLEAQKKVLRSLKQENDQIKNKRSIFTYIKSAGKSLVKDAKTFVPKVTESFKGKTLTAVALGLSKGFTNFAATIGRGLFKVGVKMTGFEQKSVDAVLNNMKPRKYTIKLTQFFL